MYSGFDESASVEYGNVIWFKLILKNMTDDTVTVTDTLPVGLKFDPKDNMIGNGSPYYVGFSMNDSDGINTSNLVPLDGTNGNRQGDKYLTVKANDYIKGQKQTVTFELKDLNKAQVNNTKHKPIAIIFGVRVDDDRWENIDFTQDTYPNTATWNKGSKDAQADVTVKRTNFGLSKTVQESNNNKKAATYTVEINKDGKQWLSTLGGELELHDTLTIPAKIDAEINRQSVKLEKYVNGVLTDVKATDLRRFTLEPMQTDGTNKVYKMTFAVPDGCYYKLTYEYRFLVGDSSLGDQQFHISNKVDMFGHGETNNNYYYNYVRGGGTASQTNTNTLQLLKVERNKYNNTLPGATFTLTHWDGSKWSEADGNYTTDTDGQILFRYTDQVKENVVNVDRGVLYKLEETTPPSGYIGDSTPHYFLMLAANQTKGDAAITTAMQGSGVAESQITFVAANQTEQMNVENTAKQITIRKVWQDANGKQESNVPHEDITVKLTRTDKATGLEDTSWSKKITLSSSNSWTYSYPDTSKNDDPLEDGYTYAVKEEKVPDGYNVSYTDSKGTERHTGLTSGDSVTITNMKKTNWLKVEKKWLAEDGKTALKDANLPESITVQLYKVNDSGVGEKFEGKTLELNAGNYWKGQFTDLDPDAKYYVVEDPVDGYTVSYTRDAGNPAVPGDTITVTNRKNAPGYELPATGSTGTAPYTTAGAVLMGAALVGGYRRKRRQERRGE